MGRPDRVREPGRARAARTPRRGRPRAPARGHPEGPAVPARASRRAGAGRQGPLSAGGHGSGAGAASWQSESSPASPCARWMRSMRQARRARTGSSSRRATAARDRAAARARRPRGAGARRPDLARDLRGRPDATRRVADALLDQHPLQQRPAISSQQQLASLGYATSRQTISVNGSQSQNVVARRSGTGPGAARRRHGDGAPRFDQPRGHRHLAGARRRRRRQRQRRRHRDRARAQGPDRRPRPRLRPVRRRGTGTVRQQALRPIAVAGRNDRGCGRSSTWT